MRAPLVISACVVLVAQCFFAGIVCADTKWYFDVTGYAGTQKAGPFSTQAEAERNAQAERNQGYRVGSVYSEGSDNSSSPGQASSNADQQAAIREQQRRLAAQNAANVAASTDAQAKAAEDKQAQLDADQAKAEADRQQRLTSMMKNMAEISDLVPKTDEPATLQLKSGTPFFGTPANPSGELKLKDIGDRQPSGDPNLVDLTDAKTMTVDPALVRGTAGRMQSAGGAGVSQGAQDKLPSINPSARTAASASSPSTKPTHINSGSVSEVDEGAWLRNQRQMFRDSIEQNRQAEGKILAALREIRVPSPDLGPKKLDDLLPGDILLFVPGSKSEYGVAFFDQIYTGRIFSSLASPASHAITFVGRDASGRNLFLDDTIVDPEHDSGSHLIGQTEFEAKYGERGIFVARPLAAVDGRALMSYALDAARKSKAQGGDYGLEAFGNYAVCTRRATFAIAKATGISMGSNRTLISVTPGDFFVQDSNGVAAYFTIWKIK